MAKKPAELNITQVKKAAKENLKQETYEFEEDGVTRVIRFYPVFSDGKITELLEELQVCLMQANEKEIEVDEKTLYKYISFLCIKHFTHLGKTIPHNNFVKQLDYMQTYIDSGYYKLILEQVLSAKEINKVVERITDIIGQSMAIDNIMRKAKNKAETMELENREIFDELNKIGSKAH